MEVIVGTYEEFLLGYKLTTKENNCFVQSFADKSHAGPLKCVAVHKHFVATGATDDRIFLYDMRSRKQTNIILSHEGTINALAFTPDSSHLISGGGDGRMIATRLNTWATEGNWKAHKGSAVSQISCHPSGKLALSLGADRVLCTWNLVKGRVAYRTNLKSRSTLGLQPDCLTWSPTGDYFILCGLRAAEIWSIKTADVLLSQKTQEKPISVCWVSDDTCLVGLENGKILWLIATDSEQEEKLSAAHSSRVKAMAFHENTLITVSSSGEMKAWKVSVDKKKFTPLCTTNIGCRPTCLSILDLTQFGDEYATKSASDDDTKQTSIATRNSEKQPERGVVTIEYEEDENDVPENESNKSGSSCEPSCSQEKQKSRKRKGKNLENVPKREKEQGKPNGPLHKKPKNKNK
ncbi:PREDICTED: p21-activated protein kinase-interacting protein 1-like isoform X3 [Rhagoletis zephyria]|uniref:p21-activated protein kinase-interacting protein 1-like isoform X1 n=1 Tax=Rhagoletis zephyria TaxID=28612 RepID=UPI0008117747|nr:PREDICTED: p21-activated protein kinase-interacting protein 1-like isoform X1 [Rhagoletis zephyria]XP_017473559.1 PREDICTED: p21-activated protein kinase-interacting protein 1-like isoform X2 [Rhagoletis zephyria]XP_017473560.1 PREDICTED: p21-activated protein kinase-interacting protein 1-like isoform X3 [Rhagoletis zephyria]